MDIHRRSSCRLLAGVLLAGCLVAGDAHAAGKHAPRPESTAPAPALVFDIAPLPVTTGQLVQYILTPAGQVSGMLLADGTQVFCQHELGKICPPSSAPANR